MMRFIAMRLVPVAALLLLPGAVLAQVRVDLKYSFGVVPMPGFTHVKPDMDYSIERGFGFDLGSRVIDTGAVYLAALSVELELSLAPVHADMTVSQCRQAVGAILAGVLVVADAYERLLQQADHRGKDLLPW